MAYDVNHLLTVGAAKQIHDTLKSAIDLRDAGADVGARHAFSLLPKGVYSTASGWRLLPENGCCVSDNGYKCIKYAVTAGVEFYVISDYMYQFQNSSSIPSNPPSNRLGVTYGKYTGFVTAPEGATYLIICTPTDGVGTLLRTYITEDFTVWNSKPYGMYADGLDVVVENWGFGYAHGGQTYYVAPTDQTTVTRISGTANTTKLLVLDTSALGSPGVRTNPTDVLKVVSVANATDKYWTCVPVAVLHSSNWIFVGAFEKFNRRPPTVMPRVASALTENHLIAHKRQTPDDIAQAKTDGYSLIEIDVRYTSDSVAVVRHDDSFWVGSTKYVIADETFATLSAAQANFMSLEAALLLAKKLNLCVDVDFTKLTYTDGQVADTYSVIAETGMLGRCMITCSAADARKFAKCNPIPIICVSSITSTSNIDALSDLIGKVPYLGCSIDSSIATSALIHYMHAKGFFAKTWTVNTAATVETLNGYSCDYVITDTLKESDL